jgi:hypothetical protein
MKEVYMQTSSNVYVAKKKSTLSVLYYESFNQNYFDLTKFIEKLSNIYNIKLVSLNLNWIYFDSMFILY